jgi:hypothetical protein
MQQVGTRGGFACLPLSPGGEAGSSGSGTAPCCNFLRLLQSGKWR